MTKDEIVSEIQRTAKVNGGEALGERSFYNETGLTVRLLRKAGFPNYGQARVAAGFDPGILNPAYSDDQLFSPLATLTREKQRFPTIGEISVAQYSIGTPSYDAYKRVAKRGPLREQLLKWCQARRDFSDVAALLESADGAKPRRVDPFRRMKNVVNGYVYLMRYGTNGKDYKIGCTNNVDRRESQIDMMSPQDVRRVHVIETDDPRGIERYWLERFADKRVKTKEIFRLTADDVAAFKARRYQ